MTTSFYTLTVHLVLGERCNAVGSLMSIEKSILMTLNMVVQEVRCGIEAEKGAALSPWQIQTECFMLLIVSLQLRCDDE